MSENRSTSLTRAPAPQARPGPRRRPDPAAARHAARAWNSRPWPEFRPVPLPPTLEISEAQVRAFFDAHLRPLTEAGRIAGAAVSVVRDGAPLFSQGYGWAELASGSRVDPDQTRFRVASVSKLLTWTALMQQVERGALGLDDPVNAHLRDFQIPASPPEPVRIRHLLTHTAGFETNLFGRYLAADAAAGRVPLLQQLLRQMPARVRPPARSFSPGGDGALNACYSDWGAALAGHLVALKSGLPFEDYVEAQIFRPCGMAHSTFREDPLPPQLATGYEYRNGALHARGFERLSPIGPAASLSTTAGDMAQFMIAQLNLGACAGTAGRRILHAETALATQARQLSPHPDLNGFGLGYFETWVNGRRCLGHAGKSVYFHADLLLMPEQRLGLFLACNSLPPSTGLLEAFVRHFFPARLPSLRPPAGFRRRATQYEGSYAGNRRSHSRGEAVFGFLLDTEDVKASDNDTLLYKGVQWAEVRPDLFRRLDGAETIAFARDRRGRVSHLLGPIAVYPRRRLDPQETGLFYAGALVSTLQQFWRQLRTPRAFGAALIAVLASLVLLLTAPWLIGPAGAGTPALARWLPAGAGLATLLILAALVRTAADLQFDFQRLLERRPWYLKATAPLSMLSLGCTLGAGACAVLAWNEGLWSGPERVAYGLRVLIAGLFLLWLRRWKLLAWSS